MTAKDPSLDPLMTLLGQAERERDEASAEMLRADAAQQAAQAQADQLIAYRAEYEARFREQFSRKSSIDILQCYQGFSARLDHAIDQQALVATQAARRQETARVGLCAQELRLASVRKLLARRLAEMRHQVERREQKQTDEYAARVAWSTSSAQPLGPAA